MLAADDRLVGIVVEIGQLLPPADPDRLARGEHDPHRGLEAARPERGGPERGRRPVERPHARAEVSAARQKLQILVELRPPTHCLDFKIHSIPSVGGRAWKHPVAERIAEVPARPKQRDTLRAVHLTNVRAPSTLLRHGTVLWSFHNVPKRPGFRRGRRPRGGERRIPKTDEIMLEDSRASDHPPIQHRPAEISAGRPRGKE
jgi:hypothetical protein